MAAAIPETRGAVPNTWSARRAGLDQRIPQVQELLAPFISSTHEDFMRGVQVEQKPGYPNSWDPSLQISVTDITSEEIAEAPEAIKMVLRDLGLTIPGDNVIATVVFKDMYHECNPRHFRLILQPPTVTEDQVGVILSSDARGTSNGVISLLGRPLHGRARLVHRIYVSDLVPIGTLHPDPDMVEILCAGAEWMSTLLNNRLSPKVAD